MMHNNYFFTTKYCALLKRSLFLLCLSVSLNIMQHKSPESSKKKKLYFTTAIDLGKTVILVYPPRNIAPCNCKCEKINSTKVDSVNSSELPFGQCEILE